MLKFFAVPSRMKFRLRARKRGSTFSEILESIWGLLFTALTIWGIFWSFYRHGPGHGAASLFFPPYAWYRGVAAIWDQPKWKDDYEVKIEQIALVIENAVNTDASYQIQSREYVRDLQRWIRSLPASEREELHQACSSYGSGLREYVERFLVARMNSADTERLDVDPLVQRHVERFKSIKGLSNAWKRFVEQTAVLKDLPSNDLIGSEERSTISVADRSATKDRLRVAVDAMSRKMEDIIDDLFAR